MNALAKGESQESRMVHVLWRITKTIITITGVCLLYCAKPFQSNLQIHHKQLHAIFMKNLWVKGGILTLEMRKMKFREASWKVEYRNKRRINISLHYLKQKGILRSTQRKQKVRRRPVPAKGGQDFTLKSEQKNVFTQVTFIRVVGRPLGLPKLEYKDVFSTPLKTWKKCMLRNTRKLSTTNLPLYY